MLHFQGFRSSLHYFTHIRFVFRSTNSVVKNRPCWVDNASITTLCFENSEDPPTDEVPSSAAAGAANQKVLDGVNNLQLGGATCKIEKDGGVDRHLNTTNTEILSLQDLHVKKLSLPDYICPSSEEKFRQAAVKEWIEKSSFPWALRTVPLL